MPALVPNNCENNNRSQARSFYLTLHAGLQPSAQKCFPAERRDAMHSLLNRVWIATQTARSKRTICLTLAAGRLKEWKETHQMVCWSAWLHYLQQERAPTKGQRWAHANSGYICARCNRQRRAVSRHTRATVCSSDRGTPHGIVLLG